MNLETLYAVELHRKGSVSWITIGDMIERNREKTRHGEPIDYAPLIIGVNEETAQEQAREIKAFLREQKKETPA